VIPFLHQNPGSLARDKTETGEAAWRKLEAFRAKVEKKHHCEYWQSADELKARVILGVTSTMKRHPAVGWVRADQVPSGATLADILALRNRVAELEAEAKDAALAPPPGTGNLEQGDDYFTFVIEATGYTEVLVSKKFTGKVSVTWNDIFAAVAPSMMSEASDDDV